MINQLLYFEGQEIDIAGTTNIDNLLLTSNYLVFKTANNNFNLTGLDAGAAKKSYFSITIINKTDKILTVRHQSASSLAGNRFNSETLLLTVPQDVVINAGSYAVCVYNQDHYIIRQS